MTLIWMLGERLTLVVRGLKVVRRGALEKDGDCLAYLIYAPIIQGIRIKDLTDSLSFLYSWPLGLSHVIPSSYSILCLFLIHW